MKMTIAKLRKMLEERLSQEERKINYDREKEELRIENKVTGKGITVSLPPMLAKWEREKEKAIDEICYYVEEALTVIKEHAQITGNEKRIFPVIRSTSFPTETADGKRLLYDEHTAETRVYYAIDLGKSYQLIDRSVMESEQLNESAIKEIALFNLRSLQNPIKKDTVRDNDFYFLNTNDGYDASRILNDTFLKDMKQKINGTMTISVPHQDVLIIADIKNNAGYDILAQMSMSFFTNGRVPITSLSFYYEDGKLEPIFILAKNPPTRKK
ncbi:DUF1444 domain-containing protein [Bacillus kwashiorkori]|uniref:DUF1444 domain-containing protein n=1 Tax=Bacillus kwashiorkori TaxID=1522318 RepID=UPI000784FA6A|nr:DUF1444 domain-containing protein [Bacillus kwashiorkori]